MPAEGLVPKTAAEAGGKISLSLASLSLASLSLASLSLSLLQDCGGGRYEVYYLHY